MILSPWCTSSGASAIDVVKPMQLCFDELVVYSHAPLQARETVRFCMCVCMKVSG